MGEAPGQGGLSDPRCACYEYDIVQVCDLVLRPGHSGSLEPFEPGSPDRESGILSAKLVDRAILPEQRLPENKFQLRVSLFPYTLRFWFLLVCSSCRCAKVTILFLKLFFSAYS